MPNLQKKRNFPLTNEAAVTAYLYAHANLLEEKKILYDFFHDAEKPYMYAKIETHIVSHTYTKYYLTVRKDAEHYDALCPEGLYGRYEVCMGLQDVQQAQDLLGVFGCTYTHSKVQLRQTYGYETAHVHIDNRYTQHMTEHLEKRVEVVGNDQEEVEKYALLLKSFADV